MASLSLNDFIYTKEGSYNKSQDLINYLESLNIWQDSRIMENKKNPARTSKQILLHPKAVQNPFSKAQMKQITKDIRSCFIEGLREYLEPHKAFCEVSQEEMFSVLKYEPGEEYKVHSDGDTGGLNRRVSGLIYLNDNFEGGETYFPYSDLTVKPKRGMMVLFPSNLCFPHASLPVTSGTKYILVGWFR